MKLIGLLIIFGLLLLGVERAQAARVAIIVDTDFAGDVDDCGALYMLNYWQSQGQCQILGVIVDQKLMSSAPACAVIDAYWGHPSIPVGQITAAGALTDTSSYTTSLAANFLCPYTPPMESTALYRQLLAKQPKRSVTFLCIGHETAFDALLNSGADRYSSLTGAQLVAAKVAKVVVMGGDYSASPNTSYLHGSPEFNFYSDAPSAADMVGQLNTLGVPTYFIGFSLGYSVPLGGMTASLPASDPLRVAYQLFNKNTPRSAWDVVAAQYAVTGTGSTFIASRGSNNADSKTGLNTFIANPASGTQYYLTLAIPPAAASAALDALYAQTPNRASHATHN